MVADQRTGSCEEIIVSLTSYPARIGSVANALASLDIQTRMPDHVVLYLAQGQFPQREDDLPAVLRQRIAGGKLELRWVEEDLGPHKKYFYALREFDGALVVTIDDDLSYAPEMIERLYQAHVCHPKAVIATRAHLMTCDDAGALLPYRQWLLEFDGLIDVPSMRLCTTGGAGALYPTELFVDADLDADAIMGCAPHADDLWLKAMEVAIGIPVVLAHPHEPLRYLPDTQDVGLFRQNLDSGGNDEQWRRIDARYEERHGQHLIDAIRAWGREHAPYESELLVRHLSNALDLSQQRTADAEREIMRLRSSRTWRAGRAVSLPFRVARAMRRRSSDR